MSKDIKAADALFGFAAWLTTRTEVVVFGASQDAASAAELVGEFIEVNDLGKPSAEYPNTFVMPREGGTDESLL